MSAHCWKMFSSPVSPGTITTGSNSLAATSLIWIIFLWKNRVTTFVAYRFKKYFRQFIFGIQSATLNNVRIINVLLFITYYKIMITAYPNDLVITLSSTLPPLRR